MLKNNTILKSSEIKINLKEMGVVEVSSRQDV